VTILIGIRVHGGAGAIEESGQGDSDQREALKGGRVKILLNPKETGEEDFS